MKKILIGLIAAFAALSFAACSNNNVDVSSENTENAGNTETVYDENGEIIKDDNY